MHCSGSRLGGNTGATKGARERYFYFQPQQPSDTALDRIAELASDKASTRAALDAYRRTRGAMNLTRIDEECVTPKKGSEDFAECRWWELVRLVGADIEKTIAVFRKSETLEDNYTEADANALVRLGRYLVVLNAKNLDEKLAAAAASRPSPRN